LRASGNDSEYGQLIEQLQLGGTVQLATDLAYEAALAEMSRADGLLLLQGPACNSQIPAKAYEYLRAGRPIMGLTDADGDTGRLLRSCGVEHVVSLIDVAGIERTLLDFVRSIQRGAAIAPRAESVAGHSRRASAARLAELFDTLAGSPH
jgi:hypothetical protein